MRTHSIYKSEYGKKKIKELYENYLASLDFAVERTYIDTSFGVTHMLLAGPKEGKPLFIFQGGNCINPVTLSWFSSVASNNKYRIYAPDTIGHPGFSDENRISAKDDSFAKWIEELMNYFNIDSGSFIGPSYGGGIILRLATYMPNKIDSAVLVSPAGIKLGSKSTMIKEILLPLLLFKATSSEKYLSKITNTMSDNSMKEIDKQVIGEVFRSVKLEQEMPKLTEKSELAHYNAPTLVIAGEKDIFFPGSQLKVADDIIPNLTAFKLFDMGHFPSEEYVRKINGEINSFLEENY